MNYGDPTAREVKVCTLEIRTLGSLAASEPLL